MGIIIQTTSAVGFVGLINSIPIYPRDKLLFLHGEPVVSRLIPAQETTSDSYHELYPAERQSSAAYSPLTFLLGYTLIELPNELIGAALFGLLINVGVGLQSNVRTYFEFVITIWAQISWGESVGIMFCSFSDSLGLSVS
jgi:ABC-type multidrug transport system permease subunit